MTKNINFARLQEMQKQLDALIYKKIPNVNSKNTFKNRILSLIVEICELSNETMCFKYWKQNKNISFDKIKEEYADCMHFFISISNDLKVDLINCKIIYKKQKSTIIFLNLLKKVVNLTFDNKKEFQECFEYFLNLGLNLDITLEEMEHSYIKKNKINIERQKANY